jgi:hypothetical protein
MASDQAIPRPVEPPSTAACIPAIAGNCSLRSTLENWIESIRRMPKQARFGFLLKKKSAAIHRNDTPDP